MLYRVETKKTEMLFNFIAVVMCKKSINERHDC